jgi:hypothetical protein
MADDLLSDKPKSESSVEDMIKLLGEAGYQVTAPVGLEER